MNQLHLRNASENDCDAIQDVTQSAYQQYAAVMPPPHWENYKQNILATLGDVRPAEQIVAEQHGAIMGAVLLYPAGTVFSGPDGASVTLAWPEVRLLAVAPAARGQGIGKALMEECVRRAQQSGSTAITLHTTDMMEVAMRMYERMGFVRTPEFDFHPAPGVTIKGYRLSLDGTI
jgi:ribosomal protein S18 acetylase RimI-like enzyme